jgi:hypothetical protein
MENEEKKAKIGRVYKVHHMSDPTVFYIGSTVDVLWKRLSNHKSAAKLNPTKKRKFFEYLRLHNFDGFRIELIEEIKGITDKTQLRLREDAAIRQYKPALNMVGATLDVQKRKDNQKVAAQQYRIKTQSRYKCLSCGYSTFAKGKLDRHNGSQSHKIKAELIVPPRVLDNDI